MSIIKFIGHYADEALGIASALTTMLDGLALSPSQADKVMSVINKLETAASNIEETLSEPGYNPVTVKISKADLEAVVKKILPDIVKEVMLADKDNGIKEDGKA